jgi:hypothetical protein
MADPRRRFRLATAPVAEHPIQRSIASVLSVELAPPGKLSREGVCWYAIDHAGYMGAVPGARLGRGVVAGIYDLMILWRGRAHVIEVKTDAGELSVDQQMIGTAVLAAGGRIGVARSADEALILLDTWGVPRARRVRIAA